MILPEDCDEKSILSDEVFEEIFSHIDPIEEQKALIAFQQRADELDRTTIPKVKERHIRKDFDKLVKAWTQSIRQSQMTQKKPDAQNNITHFGYFSDGHELLCGPWTADGSGIRANNHLGIEVIACYHPILPVERLKNIETGEEWLQLAYRRNGRWNSIKVAKDVVSTANKITQLSKFGVMVTSENARYLVRFLSDVESLNDDQIIMQESTSKLGWIKKSFVPYDHEIEFDGDLRFKQIFESVHESGDFQTWLEHVREIRKRGRIETRFMLAASFASVLVKVVGALPFIVDLWGETEGGKTVTLMLAASVWANPAESQYIGDFKTTDVALEARSDMLNNLPMILDDTSKVSQKIRDNFEGVVYDLCSGKGKSRSNRELGMNRENRWQNCTLCNGERPLNSYVNQGGAINRILEIKCEGGVFEDPQKTAGILKANYGTAGREFVDIIKQIGASEVVETFEGFQSALMSEDRMQKQAISVAVVLTADKIATDEIFQDGMQITLDEAKGILIDRDEVSDNKRCYQYITDKITMNPQRFDMDSNVEKWGIFEDEYAVVIRQAFAEICQSGKFDPKSFLSWASANGYVKKCGERNDRTKRISGRVTRCIYLKMPQEDAKTGFMEPFDPDLPF